MHFPLKDILYSRHPLLIQIHLKLDKQVLYFCEITKDITCIR